MANNPLKEITVLYVEDEAIIRDELVDILEGEFLRSVIMAEVFQKLR